MTRSQESLLRLKTESGGHRLADAIYNERTLARIKSRLATDANGCWIWQGFVHERTGYGLTSYRGKNTRAHRAMWLALCGPVPSKIDVCHTCDVRTCCNPDHLWLGTRSQNIQDMVDKRRGPCGQKAARTHCHRGHPLSGENIYTFDGHRRCKSCDRERQRLPKYRERHTATQRRRRAAKRELRA